MVMIRQSRTKIQQCENLSFSHLEFTHDLGSRVLGQPVSPALPSAAHIACLVGSGWLHSTLSVVLAHPVSCGFCRTITNSPPHPGLSSGTLTSPLDVKLQLLLHDSSCLQNHTTWRLLHVAQFSFHLELQPCPDHSLSTQACLHSLSGEIFPRRVFLDNADLILFAVDFSAPCRICFFVRLH